MESKKDIEEFTIEEDDLFSCQNIMDLQTAIVPGTNITDGDYNIQPSFMIGENFISQPLCASEDLDQPDQMIIVGVCAMAKKSFSKPMLAILDRFSLFKYIKTLVFDENAILNSPIQEWPLCDVFISFHSKGFPLDKAIKYVQLRKPIVVNDLTMQYVIQDRREVYKILRRENIAQPHYTIVDRKSPQFSDKDFVEYDDSIEVRGEVFHKPFVEKPLCAEDHNIHIYFPTSAGGGCQKLFRKVESRSSVYSSHSRVRREGSYIYEEFMQTDGTDVKVYTVGPDYVHAEARKSPALDGKVERDNNGKEVRYPVILTAKEKMMARKISLAFKQTVCGFDLLRANGRSYVCDVNGFSFVKTSSKYYDDCAKVLGTMILRALAPQLQIPWVLGSAPEDVPVVPTTSGSMMELRCIIGVIRHGDRTPKQKLKMEVRHPRFFQLFQRLGGYRTGHVKIKHPKRMQEILDIVRFLLQLNESSRDPMIEESQVKLEQLKLVLEMYGHFSGINRKVQLKYRANNKTENKDSDESTSPHPTLLLVAKWGGELTPAGRTQAQDLGKAFRSLYPGGHGEYGTPGLGILRLHSTYRHDLKIYASDEGRVQMTAAAFTKGFLALEGELPPILVQMVKCANTNGLLDNDGEITKYQHVVKEKLMRYLNNNIEFTDEDYQQVNPTKSRAIKSAMDVITNPCKTCKLVHQMVSELSDLVQDLKNNHDTSKECPLYNGESWDLLLRRWAKLKKDFHLKNGLYDISKVPDIYDCIKYDLQHNVHVLKYKKAEKLFTLSKALADIVIPQEYGMTLEEKLHIAQSYCTPLLQKIHGDLHQVMSQDETDEATRLDSRYSRGIATPHRFVRTRLYFTSESHIHSLLSMLRYANFLDASKDDQWQKAMEFISATPELNYMSQIVIMMYEDGSKTGPDRFHVELHFSPGAHSYATLKNCHNRPSSQWTIQRRDLPPSLIFPVRKISLQKPIHTVCTASPAHRYQSSYSDTIRKINNKQDREWTWDFGDNETNVLEENAVKCSPDKTATNKSDGQTCTRKSRRFVIKTVDENSENFTDFDPTKKSDDGEADRLRTSEPDDLKFDKLAISTNVSSYTNSELIDQTSLKDAQTESRFKISLPISSHNTCLNENKNVQKKCLKFPNDWNSWPEGHKASKKFSKTKYSSLTDFSQIEYKNKISEMSDRNESVDDKASAPLNIKVKTTKEVSDGDNWEVARSQSWEEKRFRQLETGSNKDHYLTVHLPLVDSKGYYVNSNFIALANSGADNPDTSSVVLKPTLSRSFTSFSAPNLLSSLRTIENLTMVPNMQPLETLHNSLTLKQISNFLEKIIHQKFVTPLSTPPNHSLSPVGSHSPLPQNSADVVSHHGADDRTAQEYIMSRLRQIMSEDC